MELTIRIPYRRLILSISVEKTNAGLEHYNHAEARGAELRRVNKGLDACERYYLLK